MNWERACEIMDGVETDLNNAKEKLKYLIENIEDLNGKQDSYKYSMEIREDFINFVEFKMSVLRNVLKTLDEKADQIG
jgi:ATP-dependent Clp protease adapter protein ClpS